MHVRTAFRNVLPCQIVRIAAFYETITNYRQRKHTSGLTKEDTTK